jgi:hypothetical protein
MATTTQLLDLICQDTGLDTGIGSADRNAALDALNRALRKICIETNGFPNIAQLSALTQRDFSVLSTPAVLDDGNTTVGSLGTIISVDWIGVADSAGTTQVSRLLQRVNPVQLMDLRGSSPTTPTFYAVQWPTVMLDGIPSEGSNLVVGHRYMPAALSETVSPDDLHPLFHEDLLARLAICLVLEGYEGREQDAAYHRGLYREAMAEYRQWLIRNGGLQNPRQNTVIWDTPGMMEIR